MKPQRNIPSLDGLRAISIGLVIIEHINQRLSNGVPPHSFRSRVLSLLLGHLEVTKLKRLVIKKRNQFVGRERLQISAERQCP